MENQPKRIGSLFVNSQKKSTEEDKDIVSRASGALVEHNGYMKLSIKKDRLLAITPNDQGYVQLIAFADTKGTSGGFYVQEALPQGAAPAPVAKASSKKLPF